MDGYWILLGMMGSGKTTVGRELATMADLPFEDTDRLLQHRLGRSIQSMFDIYGESTFRDHETSILRALDPQPGVLSTGGGIVIRPENWDELRRLGTTIYLEVDADLLIERLRASRKKRPLLEVDQWEQRLRDLLETRRPLYEQADRRVRIETQSHEEVAHSILALMKVDA